MALIANKNEHFLQIVQVSADEGKKNTEFKRYILTVVFYMIL